MTAHAVVACCAVGDFPRIDVPVLVIVHEALHTAVQMEQVRITDLPPAAPCGDGRGVPPPDVGSTDLAPLWGGRTVDYEILQLCHSAVGYALVTFSLMMAAVQFLSERGRQMPHLRKFTRLRWYSGSFDASL